MPRFQLMNWAPVTEMVPTAVCHLEWSGRSGCAGGGRTSSCPRVRCFVAGAGADAGNLVGGHRGADAAAADKYATLGFAGGYRLSNQTRKIGIIIILIKDLGTYI
jgi:hypothetical protein